MKIIPVMVHGVLDYVTAAVLAVLPRWLGWNSNVTRLLTTLSVFTVIYSLLTRYPLGLWKVIPFKGHLLIDALNGIALSTSPAWLPEGKGRPRAALVALGLFEVVAPLLSKTEQE